MNLRRDLGWPGMASLALVAVAVVFHLVAIRPLEQRSQRLDAQLSRPSVDTDQLKRVSASRHGEFYKFFHRPERADELLAKVYGIATASGLQLRAADYRLSAGTQPLTRYQITLPVSGTYTQIRSFLEAALAEIPVMSLDHASFRRKTANEGRVDTELVITLHLPRQ